MAQTPVIEVDYGALLNSARKAYHDLMTGKSARVFADANGERIEYTTANSDKLRAYITALERELGIHPRGPARGPMGVRF